MSETIAPYEKAKEAAALAGNVITKLLTLWLFAIPFLGEGELQMQEQDLAAALAGDEGGPPTHH
ncbi:MAG TPA: hypothetical protein VMR81_05700 [Patescibacteria group bacterium]|jgi:hypothetical protein|nr:hypothetical protein [Patescibacteria group bacterium]